MQDSHAKNDWLNISIGISASPVVSFEKSERTASAAPDLGQVSHPEGFNIQLEAALQYDSLSKVLNSYLAGKRFEVSEGFFKKHVIIESATVLGTEDGSLLIQADFKGSFNGTVFFTGRPVYNAEKKTVDVDDLEYDLKTRNLLLKTAKWLYTRRISSELKKYTSFELTEYYNTAASTLNAWLNKEWTRGIKGSGIVSEVKLTAVYALPQYLLIRGNCVGKWSVLVSEIDLKF